MKKTHALLVASLCWLAGAQALAADLKGIFRTANGSPVELRDDRGEVVRLTDGEMAVRLSNQSKSATFKQFGRNMNINVALFGGGANLRNFYLPGNQIGQIQDMSGFTDDHFIRNFERVSFTRCNLPPAYCRGHYPCYGNRRVIDVYSEYERAFMLQFIDSTQGNQVTGTFKTYGERFSNLRNSYADGPCR
jgi:hypothetical protein